MPATKVSKLSKKTPKVKAPAPVLSDKRKNAEVLKEFWKKDLSEEQILRIAKNPKTHPAILTELATWKGTYQDWSLRSAALRNPSLPYETVRRFLKKMRDAEEGVNHLYEDLLYNPALTEDLLLFYMGGTPESYGNAEYGSEDDDDDSFGYESRKCAILRHKNCPVSMLREAVKEKQYAYIVARNTSIPNALAKRIASPTGILAKLSREMSTDILIDLVRNPGVSQEVIRSLVPDETGTWVDGKKTRVHILKALAVNLVEGEERQRCLRLLAERSKAGGAQAVVAFLSTDEEILTKIVGSANRGIATVAANRTADPEVSQVIVALRTAGDGDETRPAKPRTREA